MKFICGAEGCKDVGYSLWNSPPQPPLCVQVNTPVVVIIIREGRRLRAVVSNGSGGKAGYIIHYLLLARAMSGNIIALGNKIEY